MAVVVALATPSGALVVLAAICLAGTSMFVRSPLLATAPHAAGQPRRYSAFAHGPLRRLLAPVFLTGVCMGALEVELPSLAIHAGSRPASGVLLAAVSLRGGGGGLWYGSRDWNISLVTRYRALLVLSAILAAPLSTLRSIPVGLSGSVLAGLAVGPALSCQYALVGRAAIPGGETEAFAWASAAIIAGVAAGSAITGASIAPSGPGAPFIIACAAVMLAAALAFGFGRLPAAQPASAHVEDRSADPVA